MSANGTKRPSVCWQKSSPSSTRKRRAAATAAWSRPTFGPADSTIYFAYPDDYTDTFIGYDEQGQFTKRPQKRAFENVFVYDRQAGPWTSTSRATGASAPGWFTSSAP